jgi:hypothetical protein
LTTQTYVEVSVPSKTLSAFPLAVNLDEADRPQLIAAACIALFNQRRTNEIGAWREKASGFSLPELLLELTYLGIELKTGNQPFRLPVQLIRRHG